MPNVADTFIPQLRDMLHQKHASASDILEMVRIYKTTKDESVKEEMREKIIANNSRLVLDMCFRYRKKMSTDMRDLFQTGVEGVLLALDKFDLSKDNNFSTYATFWVRFKVKEGVKLDSAIVANRDFYLNRSRVQYILGISDNARDENKLQKALSLHKMDGKTFERLWKETDRVYGLLNYFSLDSQVPSKDGESKQTYTIFLRDKKAANPLDVAEHNDLIGKIKVIVEKHLDDDEKRVINTMFFSKEDDLHEVAKQVGMPYKTTLYFRDRAIKKIKKWMVNKNGKHKPTTIS